MVIICHWSRTRAMVLGCLSWIEITPNGFYLFIISLFLSILFSFREIKSEHYAKEEAMVRKHFEGLRQNLLNGGTNLQFNPLNHNLKNNFLTLLTENVSELWANALLPRFWWNLFDNKSFHKFVMKRLGKRIAKITDFPKFIVILEYSIYNFYGLH